MRILSLMIVVFALVCPRVFADSTTISVSGVVYDDLNASGTIEPSDPGLASWEVELFQSGTLVADTLTAPDGSYSFGNLGAGSYTIDEVLQSGWTQTEPVSPGFYSFTNNGVNINAEDFGNFYGTPPTSAPEPSAALLFLSGALLTGLCALAKRLV